jgi:hypothetical protein
MGRVPWTDAPGATVTFNNGAPLVRVGRPRCHPVGACFVRGILVLAEIARWTGRTDGEAAGPGDYWHIRYIKLRNSIVSNLAGVPRRGKR